MLTVINLIAFQLGWFACVLGAANGLFWLGPLVTSAVFGVHLILHGNVLRESILAIVIMFIGYVTDTLLTASGVYAPIPHLFQSPFSPPWLAFMWLNFTTIVNVSIEWLSRRYLLSAILGGIGGAFAYYCGGAFGALHFIEPVQQNVIITGIVWAVLTPFFFYISQKLNQNNRIIDFENH